MSDLATTASADSTVSGATIHLDRVVKRYPGQAKPAVESMSLQIDAGSIVSFVGPSGCGKTTTLKMINRLIEPSEGRIILDGKDITKGDPVQLRTQMGYVIQSGGLFPHWTVARNVGAVPALLGWKKARISARIDELLDLVGLDPAVFRDRYPREMSGGQQQRVGVARALAADPPVLLMDEPFGAVDPITRVRLQDRLLAIQAEVAKTIVIVTHDFDEATKLGDKVLVLSEGGHIEQYAPPADILSRPASKFVSEFVGSGATLKNMTLTRVTEVPTTPGFFASVGERSVEVVRRARAKDEVYVVVLDGKGLPIAWPAIAEIAERSTVPDTVDPRLPTVGDRATLSDALDVMIAASQGGVLIIDSQGKATGALTIETVMAYIQDQRAAGHAVRPGGIDTGEIPVVVDDDPKTDQP